MNEIIQGSIYLCGDYVNTDVMAPGRFEPIEGVENLCRVAMIDHIAPQSFINPNTNRSDFSIIVAGRDFGCGSSRETATLGIYHAGVKVIIAKSISRIFYRNCINTGIYPFQINHNLVESDFATLGFVDIKNNSCRLGSYEYKLNSLGPLLEIVSQGGLSQYTQNKLKRISKL